MEKRIGLLTGGGDAPGLNGVLEASGLTLIRQGFSLIGIHDGFEGIFEGQTVSLTDSLLKGLHTKAGTFLGTSNRSGISGRETEFLEKYKKLNLQGLVVAGGDGTFAALQRFSHDIPLIGVPKTIDNDLPGTDITFGFDTACTVVADSVEALRATAEAHRRVIVVETMGRTAGWIALGGGVASMAEIILIPERPFSRDVLRDFLLKKKQGQRGLIVVVSEGAHAVNEKPEVALRVPGSPQPERYGGIAHELSRWIESETDWESRHVVLGHLQRARSPTTTDRFLSLSLGVEAARLVIENKWGMAAVYRAGRVTRAPIGDLMTGPRLVTPDHHWMKLAQALGLFL